MKNAATFDARRMMSPTPLPAPMQENYFGQERIEFIFRRRFNASRKH